MYIIVSQDSTLKPKCPISKRHHIPLVQRGHIPMSINLLPEDMLREIFNYSIPPGDSQIFSQNHWVPLGSRSIQVLILTHVCSRWRQIVLSMHYLWSTIRVSEYHRPNEVDFMHEWLSRAAAVPRTLFLALEKGRIWRDDLDPIYTIFASYAFQKLSVFPDNVYDEEEDEFETWIVLPNQLLEHLEELNIEESKVIFPDDAKLPNLQRLSITSEWEPGCFQHYSTTIPWSQIRHLTLSEISLTTHLLFSVLKQCLHLEYCKIKITDHHCTPTPFHDITLPNLQSFELSTSYHSQTHVFGVECMQRLIIPSINILQLSLWNHTSVYSRFIEQSGGMLHLHTLTLFRAEPADIWILLKQLPHLESITVSRDLGSGIWQDLSTGRLGPRLKHITCPVSSVKASLDFLKIRYHNAMRSTQQHDGWVSQPQITHFQSATFKFSHGGKHFWDMIREALESNGRGPYQCLQWTFYGRLYRTYKKNYTLDDIEDISPVSMQVFINIGETQCNRGVAQQL